MDIQHFSDQLRLKDGIYFTEQKTPISYPESGNEACYQIEENSFWFEHRNDCIVTAVKKHSPDRLFFDIGGGNGFVARGLERAGVETVLVEPGIAGAVNAKKRGLRHVVCSTLEDAQFKLGSVPAAGLFDVVEHIEDDLQFLRSIHKYLEEEGWIYITVPAYGALWSNEDRDAGHFRRYTLQRLEKLLQTAGFEIEYSTYIFLILPIPVLLFRSLPSRLGLNKQSKKVEKHRNAHAKRSGFASALLDRIWRWEVRRLERGKRIPTGGSCFVVARKRSSGVLTY